MGTHQGSISIMEWWMERTALSRYGRVSYDYVIFGDMCDGGRFYRLRSGEGRGGKAGEGKGEGMGV